MHDELAEPGGGDRPTDHRPAGTDDAGTSDDDRQPDDAGASGTLRDLGTRRPIPRRVSGSPRELLDLDPPRGKPARPRSPEPPR